MSAQLGRDRSEQRLVELVRRGEVVERDLRLAGIGEGDLGGLAQMIDGFGRLRQAGGDPIGR